MAFSILITCGSEIGMIQSIQREIIDIMKGDFYNENNYSYERGSLWKAGR